MIIFETIRWKNFLSTGNHFTEVKLNESPSTLIVGANGAGKSTILDALCFCLFNKPFRKINKPQLVNSINEKDCLVEVNFSIGSTSWKVCRGIKPAVFEIYRDGNLLDQAAATTDQQKWLEQTVLKLNYKSFTQVVILGSSTFVPFMQLPAAHRREVIEDLLDIQIFTHMNVILKDRIKITKEDLKDCEYQLSLAEQKFTMQKDHIDNLKQVSDEHVEKLKVKIQSNLDRIQEIQTEMFDLDISIVELEPKVKELTKKQKTLDKLKELKVKITQNQDKLSREYNFFDDNDSCPTCKQSISTEWKSSRKLELQEKQNEYSSGIEEIEVKLNAILEEVNTIQELSKKLLNDRHEVNSLLKEEQRLALESNQLTSEIMKEQPDLDREIQKLGQYEEEHIKWESELSQINKNLNSFKVIANLLKDGGIKSKVISKYIPTINNRINSYLQEMDFYVNFTLDEEFNEIIKSRYRDEFSYASFSEGEKQKIDLALLFTWRSIAKMKNSTNTNLLLLDEVFDSSLDSQATDELMKILRTLGSETNLFVISHKGEVLIDKFERTIKFEKVQDFSKMVEE